MRQVFSRMRDERGSALIAAGIMAASFVLLGSVVVEVGQWLSHRRHIQVRADAAALAGGQAMAECFNSSFASRAPMDMENAASDYAGITSSKNLQGLDQGTGEQSLISFQGNKYPDQQGVTRDLLSECTNLMLDVKMAETGIPKFFGFSPLETVHGWARVQAQEIVSLTPTLPLAIPDVRPKQVAVTFVNNATGAALAGCPNGCVFQLGGPTQSGQLNDWAANATIPIPAANSNVGMRVGIGAQVGSCAAGANQTTYRCYDNVGPGGVIALRSYDSTAAGSQSAPVLRAVTPSTCSGTPYFSIYQATNGTCSAGVTATVDFGASGPAAGTLVHATFDNQTVNFTRAAGTTWVSDAAASPLPIEGGPFPVTMSWCKPPTNCINQRNFTNFNGGNPVQLIYSGSDDSSSILPGGPIFAASVIDTNPASPNPVAYSFVQNQSATLAVTVGLAGGVHLPVTCSSGTAGTGAGYSCATDPPTLLRFTTGSGNDSQTYAIDCGGGNLRDMITNGCVDEYSINVPDICPDPANPAPTDCATVQTGAATGQVQQGMQARFTTNGGATCDANNYPNPGPPPNPIDKDPRAVTLIITDFSAFSGSGGSQSSDVPVVTFATFYVTGWDGAPASCNGINEPAPPQDAGNGQGSNIWGHFIADINLGAKPSGKVCLPGVTPCAIALTR
jgi:hypothetical protein